MKISRSQSRNFRLAAVRPRPVSARLLTTLLVGVVALGVAACGGSSDRNSPSSSGGTSNASSSSGATTASSSAGGSCLAQLRKSGLTAAFDGSPPASVLSASGGPVTGLMPDIFHEFMRREGIKDLHPITMPFSSMVPALKAGKIDINGTEISQTPERATQVTFLKTLYWDPDTLVVKKGNPQNIHSVKDLAGHRVGTYNGAIYVDYLNKVKKQVKFNLTLLPTPKELLAALQSGHLDAGMMAQVDAAYAIKKNPGLGLELPTGYKPVSPKSEASVHLAVRKQCTDVAAAFDKDWQSMVADGTRDRLLTKWGLTPLQKFTAYNGG